MELLVLNNSSQRILVDSYQYKYYSYKYTRIVFLLVHCTYSMIGIRKRMWTTERERERECVRGLCADEEEAGEQVAEAAGGGEHEHERAQTHAGRGVQLLEQQKHERARVVRACTVHSTFKTYEYE